MSLFDFFKKRPKYWEAYKTFLITKCQIPFNTLLPLEKQCTQVADLLTKGATLANVEHVTDDNRMLLEMGIAALLADRKCNVTLLADNDAALRELTGALRQWQPQRGTIAVGTYLPGKKGTDVTVDLFGSNTVERKR